MNVVIVVAGLPPMYTGGTEVATVEIARHAVLAGHNVHVLALTNNRLHQKYQSHQYGFTVHSIPCLPIPYLHSLSAMPNAVWTSLNSIKFIPDLIHAQGIIVAPIAQILATISNTPWLLYGRGEIYTDWLFKNWSHKLFLTTANRIVAQTTNMKMEMLKLGGKKLISKLEVVPNGIDTTRFNRIGKRAARAKLGLSQNVNIVLSVGRFRPEKNIKQVVRAALAGYHCLDNKSCYTIVVGDGEQLAEISQLAEGHPEIRLAGSIPNASIPTMMAAADVLVNTSFSEGFPVSILEGMASSLPIVAPNVCGVPEIVEDGVNGLLVDPHNTESVCSAIGRLLSTRELAKKMSENNLVKSKQYSWQNVVTKLYC